MEILKVDHIGFAVKNMEESLKFYSEILGLTLAGIEEVAEQKVKIAFFPVGDTEIEVLESTDPQGPIAKYIESRGTGIQHIALRVEDIKSAIAEMEEQGVVMIDRTPKESAGGTKIAFCHPKSTGGILIELLEK